MKTQTSKKVVISLEEADFLRLFRVLDEIRNVPNLSIEARVDTCSLIEDLKEVRELMNAPDIHGQLSVEVSYERTNDDLILTDIIIPQERLPELESEYKENPSDWMHSLPPLTT